VQLKNQEFISNQLTMQYTHVVNHTKYIHILVQQLTPVALYQRQIKFNIHV